MFAQDSWRARSNLTVNYGVRWDIMAPWYEKDNQIQTIVPGQQSAVYPDAPAGLVFPGDAGIARGLSPTRFGQRLAARRRRVLAEREDEPARELRVVLHGVSGTVGRHHVRRAAVRLQLPEPGAAAVRHAVHHGRRRHQQRPAVSAAVSAARRIAEQSGDQHRLVAVPAGQRRSVLRRDNKTPYSANFMFSVQRELAPNMVVTASYVGTRGHNMLVMQQANPGDPALCLSVSQPSQVAPGSATCGPFARERRLHHARTAR